MKKALALILALVMMLALTACGESKPAPTPAPTPAPEPAPAPIPGGGGGSGGGGGRDRKTARLYVDNPPEADSLPEISSEVPDVLGALRENGRGVIGALRNPGQVLGAARTGDTSAMFICGEIFAMAMMLLGFWVMLFKKLRRKE